MLPRPDPRFLRLEVRNPERGTRYTVALPAFPSRDGAFCGCADFGRRGLGTCKHLEAAWIWTQEHPEQAAAPRPVAPTRALWAEIDRRLRRKERGALSAAARVRRGGAALLG